MDSLVKLPCSECKYLLKVFHEEFWEEQVENLVHKDCFEYHKIQRINRQNFADLLTELKSSQQ